MFFLQYLDMSQLDYNSHYFEDPYLCSRIQRSVVSSIRSDNEAFRWRLASFNTVEEVKACQIAGRSIEKCGNEGKGKA